MVSLGFGASMGSSKESNPSSEDSDFGTSTFASIVCGDDFSAFGAVIASTGSSKESKLSFISASSGSFISSEGLSGSSFSI